jgi:5-formyltetrahydrofolate cyclo-ligase
MDVVTAKRAARRHMRARLASLGASVLHDAGVCVALALVPFIEARTRGGAQRVALFASLPKEIDTRPLDEALRRARLARALPAVVDGALVFRALDAVADIRAHDLPSGMLSIPTPGDGFFEVDLDRCDVVVVPGLAFDARGGRLGYGRALYDRVLARVQLDKCVGIALDEQLIEEVPREPHDIRLRWLCTPARGVFPVDDESARG